MKTQRILTIGALVLGVGLVLAGTPLGVTAQQTIRNITISAALPTGTNSIGQVTANAGTNLNTSTLLTSTNFAAAFGTAGSADAQVQSVQGIASMTPLLANPGTATLWGVHAEDAAHSSGHAGTLIFAVRQSTQADFGADNDYTPFSVNDDGELRVTMGAGASGGTAADDDADFTDGSTPFTPIGGVYESTPSTVTDGDMGMAGLTTGRALKVAITNPDGSAVTYQADSVFGTATYTEATSSGPLVGAVRNDTLATLVNTDNEVGPLQMNASGALYVEAALSATDNAVLDNIDADLTTLIGHADGIEGLLTTIDADTSALAALIESDDGVIAAVQTVQRTAALTYLWNGSTWARSSAGIASTQHYRTSAGATEDEFEVKATAGVLTGGLVTNTAATVAYLRCANLTAANTTPGTSTVFFGSAIPAQTTGAGFTLPIPEGGLTFSTALTCWIVTGEADSDTTEVGADDVKVNLFFR